MIDLDYLKELIDDRGITKTKLAKVLDMSRVTLDTRLSGEIEFSLVELDKLCSFLRLSVEERQKILLPMFKNS